MSQTTWQQTWMATAQTVARRSPCEKGQVGAVIVSGTNRIVATGFNGPPAGWEGTCERDCPRGRAWSEFQLAVSLNRDMLVIPPALSPCYDDCVTIHAEANALSFCDRRDRKGGTIYVSGSVCYACAKLIANSGLARVVMSASGYDEREGDRVVEFLRFCGLRVAIQ